MPGHYSGRLKSAAERANEKTSGRDGAFYSILKKHNFYDIDDTDNGLEDWQRAGVPDYNQRRMSALASAISDMFTDFLTNDDYGVLVPCLETIIDKMDMRDSMSAAEMDMVSGSLNAIPGGSAIDGARQAISQIVAAVMGGSKFDPDMIPPLCIGFSGLPISLSNVFKAGTFTPNWEFLYDHEPVKSTKFYAGPNNEVMLGAGIPLTLGGTAKVLVLKTIFSVPSIDNNGNPVGDVKGGVTAEEFDTIYNASEKEFTALDDEALDFEITENQMRIAYYKYIQLILWGAITNQYNWAYLHWGALAHNSFPEPVKTALCSYLQTSGLAVDPNINAVSGLLSYCANIALAYTTGRDKPVGLLSLKDMKYLGPNKNKVVCDGKKVEWIVSEQGVPKDRTLANRHFAIIADILAHLTPGEVEGEYEIRRRRVDEANLIYRYLGLSEIKFGAKINDQPRDVIGESVAKRGLHKMIGVPFNVYPNECSKAGNVQDVDIRVMAENKETFSDKIRDTLGSIMLTAGAPGAVVTSLFRSDEDQAGAMFKNKLNQKFCSYGPKGRRVNAVYDKEWNKLHPGEPVGRIEPEHQDRVRRLMVDEAKAIFKETGTHVSNHTSDPSEKVAIDVGPGSTRVSFKYSSDQMQRIHNSFRDARTDGYIAYYLGPKEFGPPKDDPAMHWELYVNDKYKKPQGVYTGNYEELLPSIECVLNDINMSNESNMDSILIRDNLLAEMESGSGSEPKKSLFDWK